MSIAIASDAALGISQEERLQRALAGDDGAFAWIVETFSSDMAQVCLVVVGDLVPAIFPTRMGSRYSSTPVGRSARSAPVRTNVGFPCTAGIRPRRRAGAIP
jgi:hypothetical protein